VNVSLILARTNSSSKEKVKRILFGASAASVAIMDTVGDVSKEIRLSHDK